jgi:hypothetical protein
VQQRAANVESLVTRFERIGTSANGGRHRCVHPSARHKSIPVAVYCAAVVAWTVRIIIAGARAHDSPLIRRSVSIVGIRIRGRIIRRGIIITAIIRRHIRPFRTSNHESCNDACTKDRQQECSTAAHGFGFCYRLHQMFPFRLSCDFPVLSRSRALFRAWDLVKKDVCKVGRISVHQTRHPPYLGTSA